MFKVLIVDDEVMIKRSLAKLIADSPFGFEAVGEADDGNEALALCEKLRPDLLITDIRMPVMDGLELVSEVRLHEWDMDIAILSGYDDFAYAQQALRHGVADYLLKPLQEEQLHELLANVSARLEERRRATAARSRWLKECKALGEELAERLWLLNEEEAQRRMEEICGRLSDDGLPAAQLASRLEDVLVLAEAGLLERAQGGLAELGKPLLSGAEAPGQLLAQAKEVLRRQAELIRASRNWGQRQSISRAVRFLETHFAEGDVTLQQAAEQAGMSVSYFSRCFKEETGMSFTDYVIKLRMDKAMELLRDPSCKTLDAALAVGYGDYPHFAKSFKKYCGLSPNEYKKRMAGGKSG
ncbi:response regulator transcription factor [Paenibacillus hamazuiensis]|uniref:response regulator transcription factor n=1 Tax=Paenibacillus hamazuiensis TaxID=2936508 RepID=UPI00200F2BF2|nr:response regulator [Paenibacillus hamazuiensis]